MQFYIGFGEPDGEAQILGFMRQGLAEQLLYQRPVSVLTAQHFVPTPRFIDCLPLRRQGDVFSGWMVLRNGSQEILEVWCRCRHHTPPDGSNSSWRTSRSGQSCSPAISNF